MGTIPLGSFLSLHLVDIGRAGLEVDRTKKYGAVCHNVTVNAGS